MTMNFNLGGADRIPLVKAVSQILDTPAVYLKVPTCAYQVGEYNICKDGALAGPDNRQLVAALEEQAFPLQAPSMTLRKQASRRRSQKSKSPPLKR